MDKFNIWKILAGLVLVICVASCALCPLTAQSQPIRVTDGGRLDEYFSQRYWSMPYTQNPQLERDGVFIGGHRTGKVYERGYDAGHNFHVTTIRHIAATGDWSGYDAPYAYAKRNNLPLHFRVTFSQTVGSRPQVPDSYRGQRLPMIGSGVLRGGSELVYDFIREWCNKFKARYPDESILWDVVYLGQSGEPDGDLRWTQYYEQSEWYAIHRRLLDISIEVFGASNLVIHASGAYPWDLNYFVEQGGQFWRSDNFGGNHDMGILLKHARSGEPRSFLFDRNQNKQGGGILETRFSMRHWPKGTKPYTPAVLAMYPDGQNGNIQRIFSAGIRELNGIVLANMGEAIPPQYRQDFESIALPMFQEKRPPGRWLNPWNGTLPPPDETDCDSVTVAVEGHSAYISDIITLPGVDWSQHRGKRTAELCLDVPARIWFQSEAPEFERWAVKEGGAYTPSDGSPNDRITSLRTENRTNIWIWDGTSPCAGCPGDDSGGSDPPPADTTAYISRQEFDDYKARIQSIIEASDQRFIELEYRVRELERDDDLPPADTSSTVFVDISDITHDIDGGVRMVTSADGPSAIHTSDYVILERLSAGPGHPDHGTPPERALKSFMDRLQIALNAADTTFGSIEYDMAGDAAAARLREIINDCAQNQRCTRTLIRSDGQMGMIRQALDGRPDLQEKTEVILIGGHWDGEAYSQGNGYNFRAPPGMFAWLTQEYEGELTVIPINVAGRLRFSKAEVMQKVPASVRSVLAPYIEYRNPSWPWWDLALTLQEGWTVQTQDGIKVVTGFAEAL